MAVRGFSSATVVSNDVFLPPSASSSAGPNDHTFHIPFAASSLTANSSAANVFISPLLYRTSTSPKLLSLTNIPSRTIGPLMRPNEKSPFIASIAFCFAAMVSTGS